MSEACGLSTYAELADLIEDLPLLVREQRRRSQLSLRAAAHESGVSFSTLNRLEAGEDVAGTTIKAVLIWLNGGERHAARLAGQRAFEAAIEKATND